MPSEIQSFVNINTAIIFALHLLRLASYHCFDQIVTNSTAIYSHQKSSHSLTPTQLNRSPFTETLAGYHCFDLVQASSSTVYDHQKRSYALIQHTPLTHRDFHCFVPILPKRTAVYNHQTCSHALIPTSHTSRSLILWLAATALFRYERKALRYITTPKRTYASHSQRPLLAVTVLF